MYKIIADENIPELDTYFADLGEIKRVNGRNLKSKDLEQGVDILLVRSVTQVNQALLAEHSPKFVGTATIGVNHLDIHYLDERGIAWANAPGSNADSVVDYVISSICNIDDLLADLVAGDTVGIIGLGNVGKRLYDRLSLAGIRCKAFDPLLNESDYSAYNLVSLEEVLSCRMISCHAPLTRCGDFPSYHLLGTQQLEQLSANAVLLNAGRGEVIDNQALYELMSKRDLCCVLDVWEHEPTIHPALFQQCYLKTPHIAGYAYEGKARGISMLRQQCEDLLELEKLAVVNDNQSLSLNADSDITDSIEQVRSIVLQAYNVREDCLKMERSLLTANDWGQAFDQLRKAYPIRHEFSAYTVSGASVQSAKLLSAFGFTIAAK